MAVVYRSEPLAFKRIIRFATQGFPRTFRETAWFTLTAALLLILPALAAGLLTNWRPEASTWLLPPQVQTLIPQIEDQDLWTDIPIEERPYASSFIMTNNIRVTFMAFVGWGHGWPAHPLCHDLQWAADWWPVGANFPLWCGF